MSQSPKLNAHNPQVDQYLIKGCGRCLFYQTPKCKVHAWRDILIALRGLILETGLQEEYKWSQPCYTWQGKNVLIVTAFKNYAALAFFKGALLDDPKRLLVKPGKNSQAGRQLRFTTVNQVSAAETTIKQFLRQAINVEEKGQKVTFKKSPEPLPAELKDALEASTEFKVAFEKLSPGRQRGYCISIGQAKQAKTRLARIEKYRPQILQGLGVNDVYKVEKKL